MTVSIGPASIADRAAIERVVNDAYAKYVPRIGKKPGPMLDDYAALITAGEVWVLREDGSVAGVLVLKDAGDHLLLDNIAVAPDRQGHGLGRRLMDFADSEVGRRGYGEVRLYTHALMHENQRIYRALGWEEYARGNESGYDRVFMRKHLTG